METMVWTNILALIGALGGLEFVKWLFNRKTEKRLNDIEVRQKEMELMHGMLEKANALNDNLLGRISEANAAVDKYIDRTRELSDKLYDSEQETNRVNDRLVELTAKNGKLELLCNKYKDWHCKLADCEERQPPNPKLRGKKFIEGINIYPTEKKQNDEKN